MERDGLVITCATNADAKKAEQLYNELLARAERAERALSESGKSERIALSFCVATLFGEGYFDGDKDKERIRAWLLNGAEKIPDDLTIEQVFKDILK